jgi:hypothetical protein
MASYSHLVCTHTAVCANCPGALDVLLEQLLTRQLDRRLIRLRHGQQNNNRHCTHSVPLLSSSAAVR